MIKHTREESISNEVMKAHLAQKTGHLHGLLEEEQDYYDQTVQEKISGSRKGTFHKKSYGLEDFYILSEDGKTEIPNKDMKRLAEDVLDLQENESVASIWTDRYSLKVKIEKKVRYDEEAEKADEETSSFSPSSPSPSLLHLFVMALSSLYLIFMAFNGIYQTDQLEDKAEEYCNNSTQKEEVCLKELGYNPEDIHNEE